MLGERGAHDCNEHVENDNVGKEGGHQEEYDHQRIFELLPILQLCIVAGALKLERPEVAQYEEVLIPHAFEKERAKIVLIRKDLSFKQFLVTYFLTLGRLGAAHETIDLEHVEAGAEHNQEGQEDKHEAPHVLNRACDQVDMLRETVRQTEPKYELHPHQNDCN